MSDPLGDRLRQAMHSEASSFAPAETVGATRRQVVERVRRRHRQVVSSAGAALVLMATGIAVLALARPNNAARHQVAANGANPSPAPTRSGGAPGSPVTGSPGGEAGAPGVGTTLPTGTPGTQVGTGPGPTGTASPPTSAAAVGGGPGPSVPPTVAVATTVPTTATVGPSPSTSVTSAASQVRGTVLVAAACPVAMVSPATVCTGTTAPKPGSAHIQLLRNDGTVAAQGDAGSNGRFTLSVAPGTYTVKAQPVAATTAAARSCTADPAMVTVESGAVVNVAVSCTATHP